MDNYIMEIIVIGGSEDIHKLEAQAPNPYEAHALLLEQYYNFEKTQKLKCKIIRFYKEVGKVGRPRHDKSDLIQVFKKEGMTQEKVARQLDISLSTVRRNWES